MTLQELLKAPFMGNAHVLAGSQGLDSNVNWCIPDTELKLHEWTIPDFLLLYTGKNDAADLIQYIEAVRSSNPCGILLFSKDALTLTQETDLSYFDENRLALIQMPPNVNPLNFTKNFTAYSASHFHREQQQEAWLRELTYSGSRPGMDTIAEAYGYCPEYNYYCLLLRLCDTEVLPLIRQERTLDSIRILLTDTLSLKNVKVLSFTDSPFLVCFVPQPKGESTNLLRGKIETAFRKLQDVFSKCEYLLRIGSLADSLDRFAISYQDTLCISSVIEALHISENPAYYYEWYLHTFLLKEPRETLRIQAAQLLAPILEVPELFETLRVFLGNGKSMKVTAEKLYIHINTLKYRLQKISELLDCDLQNYRTCVHLGIAITIECYLRYTA